jgi:hypothetical protein
VTVNPVEPTIPPELAVMLALPAETPVAAPDELIVATLVLEEDQATEEVKFSEVPSVNTPVAVNCWPVPVTMELPAGDTWMELSMPSTVSGELPLTVPEVAVMLVDPCPEAVARPEELTAATVELLELQVTLFVMFCVLPSLNVPVAENCWVCPMLSVGLKGET